MRGDVMVAVDVPQLGDDRHKNWAKIVHGVDTNKSTGWAYEGTFVATGGIQDVEAPSVLLVYGERGSRSNPQPEARVYVVNTDGTLSHHATATGRAWARTLRDPIVDLLDQDAPRPTTGLPWDPALSAYSTEALSEELSRRAD